ncbi:MAG: DUF4224 domain-containing protein [Rhodanobacteraceae bacterium]
MTDAVRLSRSEMADFTGSPQRAHQIGFLRLNGIPHYVDAHGWPVVLWRHLDPQQRPKEDRKPWKPNKAA